MAKKASTKKVAATKKATKKTPAKKVLHKTQPEVEVQRVEDRAIIYPTPNVVLHIGEKAITVEKAKKLLGWVEETDKKFAEDFVHDIRALFGKKIRLYNNSRNRPIQPQSIQTLAQEVLRKNWHLNFETIIVGETGLILNGQHSLLALIYAASLWEKDKEKYEGWDSEPTMEKLVGYGCSESLNVIKTMDTCKPSSLSDVIYRCDYFHGHSPKACKVLCKIAEFAVRQVWNRTGVGNAFSPGLRGTHSEFLSFIDRHPKLLDCVKHIYEEEDPGAEGEDKKKISKVISCGYAAGLLYLMGCSQSDPKSYHEADPSNEDMLDWSMWEPACDFWVGIAGKEKKFLPIRQALGKTIEDDDSSVAAKVCIVIKAWNLHAAGKTITVDDLLLKYETDEDGERTLVEHPTLGGIDLGNPKDQPDPEVTEDEVKASKARVDKEKATTNGQTTKTGLATKLTMKKGVKKAAKKVATKGGPKVGDVVWVLDDGGGHWSGQLMEVYATAAGPVGRILVAKGFAGAGKTFESPMSKVQLTKPENE